MKRRHFLIEAASCLPCCLLPADFVRRAAAALEAGDTAAAIAAPTRAATTLFAIQEDYRILFSLNSTVTEPGRLTWRMWADMHYCDIDDRGCFHELAIEECLLREDQSLDTLFESPDDDVPADLQENYIEWGWAHTDSPQAQAYHYLSELGLGNSEGANGDALGALTFIEGPMPGSNWTWVETDDALVLPALQRRLLEIGEDIRIEAYDL